MPPPPRGRSRNNKRKPVLDHLAFPYVVDRILQFASPEVLLAFRRTSTAYKARVDRMVQHLDVDMVLVAPSRTRGRRPKGQASAQASAPVRQIQLSSTMGWACPPIVRPDMSTMTEVDALVGIKADRARLEPILSRATVLDLHGPLSYNLPTIPRGEGRPHPPPDLLHLSERADLRRRSAVAWNGPKYLRVTSDHLGRYPSIQKIDAETLVIFAGAAHAGPGEKCLPPNHIEPSALISKIVINIPYRGTEFLSQDGHADLLMNRNAYTEQVVFVFHEVNDEGHVIEPNALSTAPRRPRDGNSEALFEYEDDGAWISIHESISEIMRFGHPTFTFVNLPARLRMGDKLINPAEALFAHIEFEAIEKGFFGYLKRVHIRTIQEYKNLPGVEAELEMKSRRWPTSLSRSVKDHPRFEGGDGFCGNVAFGV